MRKVMICFGLLMLIVASCQQRTKAFDVSSDEEYLEVDTTPKATAICWVDKACSSKNKLPVVRTAKVYACIYPYGRIGLKSFVKEQPMYVQSYLRYRLKTFRVPKVLLDSGYVKLGEQYLQLRYFPDLATKFD